MNDTTTMKVETTSRNGGKNIILYVSSVTNVSDSSPLVIQRTKGGETTTFKSWSWDKFLLGVVFLPIVFLRKIYKTYSRYADKFISLGETSVSTTNKEEIVENYVFEKGQFVQKEQEPQDIGVLVKMKA